MQALAAILSFSPYVCGFLWMVPFPFSPKTGDVRQNPGFQVKTLVCKIWDILGNIYKKVYSKIAENKDAETVNSFKKKYQNALKSA